MGDEGIRLGKICFGVGALAGGDEDIAIDTAIGSISEMSVGRCRSVARMCANLVRAGGLSSSTITSLMGWSVVSWDPFGLGR